MTDIHAVIAGLKALEAKATPGAWLYQKDPGIVGHKEPDLLYIGKRPIFVNEPIYNIADYDLCIAVSSRNALPLLLAYIDRLEAVASAAWEYRDSDPDRDGENTARKGWKLDEELTAIAVGFRGANYFLEIKREGSKGIQAGKLRKTQGEWFAEWRGTAAVVKNIDEALEAIGAKERAN